MFEELTEMEQCDIDGGFLPAVPAIVKGIIVVGGIIFLAGSVKGCTDEAAKKK